MNALNVINEMKVYTRKVEVTDVDQWFKDTSKMIADGWFASTVEHDEQFWPRTFLLYKEEEDTGDTYTEAMLPLPFTNDEEKQFMLQTVKFACKTKEAVGYIFTSEAWMAAMDAENVDEEQLKQMKSGELKLADYEGEKQEVLFINAQTKTYNNIDYWKISKTSEGTKFIERGPDDHYDPTKTKKMGGAFANILCEGEDELW